MLRKVWASLEVPANLCRAFHNVRLSITDILMGQFTGFQIKQHEAFQQVVIEDKVNIEVLRLSADAVLTSDKRESFPEFQEKRLQILQKRSFEVCLEPLPRVG